MKWAAVDEGNDDGERSSRIVARSNSRTQCQPNIHASAQRYFSKLKLFHLQLLFQSYFIIYFLNISNDRLNS